MSEEFTGFSPIRLDKPMEPQIEWMLKERTKFLACDHKWGKWNYTIKNHRWRKCENCQLRNSQDSY